MRAQLCDQDPGKVSPHFGLHRPIVDCASGLHLKEDIMVAPTPQEHHKFSALFIKRLSSSSILKWCVNGPIMHNINNSLLFAWCLTVYEVFWHLFLENQRGASEFTIILDLHVNIPIVYISVSWRMPWILNLVSQLLGGHFKWPIAETTPTWYFLASGFWESDYFMPGTIIDLSCLTILVLIQVNQKFYLTTSFHSLGT